MSFNLVFSNQSSITAAITSLFPRFPLHWNWIFIHVTTSFFFVFHSFSFFLWFRCVLIYYAMSLTHSFSRYYYAASSKSCVLQFFVYITGKSQCSFIDIIFSHLYWFAASSKSCVLQFYLYMTGKSPGSLSVNIKVNHKGHEIDNKVTISGNQGRLNEKKMITSNSSLTMTHHLSDFKIVKKNDHNGLLVKSS